MRTKNTLPLHALTAPHAPALMQVYFEFNHLKQLFRQGWLRRGIPESQCESVAEHSLGVVFLALALAEQHFPELDILKVVKMALLHDFGEIYAGDITPNDPVTPEAKREREHAGVVEVFGKLPGGAAYLQTWEEYEMGNSPEARFVRQIDRLEMGLQASVYEYQQQAALQGKTLAEFFASTEAALEAPALREFFAAVQAARAPQP